ncbi:MAG: hypothetical protein ACYDCQ_04230 [Dehalococcoidia bacterium]
MGPIGPAGPVGLQGPKGDAGAPGTNGQQGPKGDTGATGAVGPAGPGSTYYTTTWDGGSGGGIANGGIGTLSVGCNAGDTAVGGGVKSTLPNGFGNAHFWVSSSFPSGAGAWETSLTNQSGVAINGLWYVVCAHVS